MSTPLAMNDTLQITYKGHLYAQTIETVLHARVNGSFTGGATGEAQLVDLVAKLSDPTFPFLLNYLGAAGNDFVMDYVRVQKVAPFRTIYVEEPIAAGGGFGSICATTNLAASIEKQSATVGRKGVGRLQFGPVPASEIIGGFINSTYIAVQLTDLANTMFGSFVGGPTYGGSFVWCLPANATTPGAYDIFNAFAYPTARTMHRRTVGLGI